MHTLRHGALAAALLTVAVQLPAQQTTSAQARTARAQQTRQNCVGTADTSRTFQRALGDSLVAGTRPVTGGTARSRQYPEYDVVLEVPGVCVERLTLKVDSVTAKLALDARVSNLVRVNVGADVLIESVDLTIEGVRARALLLVDLDNVVHIVDQTLTFVDNHPEVVEQLTSTLANTGQAVGGLVGGLVRGLVLTTTKLANGGTLEKVIDQATGSIIERTLSAAGQQVAQKALGNVLQLPAIRETTNAAGETVRQVRDQAGSIIEYTLEKGTRAIKAARIVGG